jgi:hypothetical protein
MSRQCLGRLSGYSVDVRTVFCAERAKNRGERASLELFFFGIDCILTSHGYRGKVYPTYCRCHVFTARFANFSEAVELRCFLLQVNDDSTP